MTRDTPHVVVAGGGVAGLEVLLGLNDVGEGRIETLLVNPGDKFVYTPISVVEPFDGARTPVFDLDKILEGTGTTRRAERAVRVDVDENVLYTDRGARIHYESLVLALGAHKIAAVENAMTFSGPADREAFAGLLAEIADGEVTDLAFVVPTGTVWALPIYELALLTSGWLRERDVDANLTLITPEALPLRLFGLKASRSVIDLLNEHEIALMASTHIAGYDGEVLSLVPGSHLHVQRVVAVPRLEGPGVAGLPHDLHGFLRTDGYGLVEGTTNVYAAGDGTNFPVKQGVIAAEQSDAIVSTLAARYGAPIEPHPFRPVMRGLLIAPDGPLFMQAEVAGGCGDAFAASREPLWESADKVPGRYLSYRLAKLGLSNSSLTPDLKHGRETVRLSP